MSELPVWCSFLSVSLLRIKMPHRHGNGRLKTAFTDKLLVFVMKIDYFCERRDANVPFALFITMLVH